VSADNGIYIAQFPDGFRVAYAQCIENIDYYPKHTRKRKDTLKAYFGGSEVFRSEKDAKKYAVKLYREMEKDEEENGMGFFVLEYGVCILPEIYENWD